MSKPAYAEKPPKFVPLGEYLRELRLKRELPLRVVAEAACMDLSHLQKIELGQRLPTEDQTSLLAKFFRLDENKFQARRIVEKFRQEYADNPAAPDAIMALAEEAGIHRTGRK